MHIIRTICLFLAVSIILAHSVFPHHHHIEIVQQVHLEDNDHHTQGADHHHADADRHHHSIFTFSQIDNIFLTGKQVVIPFAITAVLFVFEWSFSPYVNQGPGNFYITDIELPPLLRWQEISFRGPPSI